MATTTSETSISTASSLLSDPTLTPFLSDNFSPTSYLNTTLPPLASTSSSSTSTSSPAVSLQSLHSTSTSLLSSLDIQLSRLQATLSTLTDEIIRATPRLSYEVEVLRSDVISLAETLASTRTRQLTEGLADISLEEAAKTPEDEDTNGNSKSNPAVTTDGDKASKPVVMKRLETLAIVRRHLEDVIKVFGEAMEWTLNDNQKTAIPLPTTATSSLGAYIPPSRSPSPAIMDGRKRGGRSTPAPATAGSDKFTDEISYLLLNNEVDKATKKVEELARLCEVWKNTSEYTTRQQIVENLRWKVMEATKVEDDIDDNSKEGDRGVYTINLPDVSITKEGYLGFINQFKQMRDSIGQSG